MSSPSDRPDSSAEGPGGDAVDRSALPGAPVHGARRWFPPLVWWPGYGARGVKSDALAGAAVAALLVPQAMAYALLAGLPPRSGLLAAIVPPLAYALLGTSRFLGVGPVALASLIVAEGTGRIAAAQGVEPVAVGVILAFEVGLVLAALGVLRFGVLADLVGDPVVTGFTSAAAILIATSQVPHLLGVDAPRGGSLVEALEGLWPLLGNAHRGTMIVAAVALGVLLLAGKPLDRLLEGSGMAERRRLVAVKSVPLVVVLAAAGAVLGFGLDRSLGLEVVGAPGMPVPRLALPILDLGLWRALLPTALAAATVVAVPAVALARSLEERQERPVDASQELLALGAGSLVAGATGGYPVGGSFSRSAVAAEMGARSPLAGVMAAVLVTVAAVFGQNLVAAIPKAVLAAIIVTAVVRLVDFEGTLRIWRYSASDGISLAVTFFTVLAFGVTPGIGAGVLLALGFYIWRTSRPRVTPQGRLGESEHYVAADEADDGDEVEPAVTPVLVLRIDQDLYFANGRYVREQALEAVGEAEGCQCLLLDFRGVNEVDASGFEVLEELVDELRKAGIDVGLSEVKTPILERFRRLGFIDHLGEDRLFLSTHRAMELAEQTPDGCFPAREDCDPDAPEG